MDVGVGSSRLLRSYRAGGLVTLGVPQNLRRKVVTVVSGRTNNIEHVIDTGDNKPVKQRYYLKKFT
jgi:hypothetical protein